MDKKCYYCDNILENQEYILDVDIEDLDNIKRWQRIYLTRGDVVFYTDKIIMIKENCYYSKNAKYYINKL